MYSRLLKARFNVSASEVKRLAEEFVAMSSAMIRNRYLMERKWIVLL
jgi:hypothetical protein